MASLTLGTPRRLLTKARRLAGQLRVYAADEALEFDDFTQGELRRRRIFYDDVLLVTRHRSVGWLFLAVCATLAALFAIPAAGLGREDLRTGLSFFGITGGPFLVAVVIRLLAGSHTVTVWGRRSRARIPLGLRGGRAREVFREVCRLVREEQARGAD